MGKKLISQVSSGKICKADKKQLNSLINVLKPKVYITESSNFKRLVQELTGNGNGYGYIPISFNPPPVFQLPIIDIDSPIRENSFDSSIDSSEASFPTTVSAESSADVYAFQDNVLESSSSFVNNIDFPACGDIESWLLEIDNYSFNYDLIEDCILGGVQQQVSVSGGYDFSDWTHLI